MTQTPSTTTMTYLSILLLQSFLLTTHAMPMRHSIPRNSKECLYTSASSSEHITASLFITDGTDLKAKMIIQGPIASKSVASSAEVLAAGLRIEKTGGDLSLNIDTVVDFETIYDEYQEMIDDDFEHDDDDGGMDDVDDTLLEEYYYLDDDDQYEFLEDDYMDEEELKEIREEKEKRDRMSKEEIMAEKHKRREAKMERLEGMKKARQAKKDKRRESMSKTARRYAEKRTLNQKKGLEQLRHGEPLQKTYQVEDEGWYRFCISPVDDLIEVEMELRKTSEVGKPNKKTGHLSTYEHHEMQQHEKKLLKRMNNKNLEANGVREKDLEMTRKQITKLNKLLYEIKEKQMHERHRLAVHKAVNEHSHSRMVMNSLFETMFYIGVSAFQVYTIRKWFTGSPILSY